MILYYMKNDVCCTKIEADYVKETVRIENYTNDLLDRAFGIVEKPSFKEYEDFLESRCVPRSRGDIKSYLKSIGVDFYDPISIIRKTKGVMAEDQGKFWIRIEEV